MSRSVCLITGASTGIGAACAQAAAARGYDLALTYQADRAGMEQVAEAAEKAGAKVLRVQTDVADPAAITALFAQIDDTFGTLDALINNAGIVAPTARVTELTHARLRHMFDVNVIGAMLVASEAVKRMEPRRSGVIVNITSVAARLGSAGLYVDYAASKAAMETFTKGLADEVAGSGIRVVAVAPGLIETPIHAKGGEPGRAERLGVTTPMGRAGTPEEIARAALWLMSEEASYVTGTTLTVSGGR